MPTMSVSEARTALYTLLDKVAVSHEPVMLTGKRNRAVLVAEEDWRAITETLHLLNIPGMRESIIESMATPFDECSDAVDWRRGASGLSNFRQGRRCQSAAHVDALQIS